MTSTRKTLSGLAILAVLAMVVALGVVPLGARAADHLDAPGLTSPGGEPQLDINDLYVFEGENPGNTVLAVTVNPAAAGDTDFATWREGSYHLRIDRMDATDPGGDEDDDEGDADDQGDDDAAGPVEDVTFSALFIDKFRGDGQWVIIYRATGERAGDDRARGRIIGFGSTEDTIRLRGGGMAFAGLRSDPFFFDLFGFLGTVEGATDVGGRMLGDGSADDFFDELNTLAIVIEVPDARVGSNVGVWATTTARNGDDYEQVDRLGRPAINTVVNSSGPIVGADPQAKNAFNSAHPEDDVEDFTGAVADALQAYSSLDAEGAYSDAQAAALASVLLPDVLTYDTSTPASGPLNGRALADDVIDIELRIVTGGDPLGLFMDRDADGAVNADGVGPHTDYLSSFPYLGVPHS